MKPRALFVSHSNPQVHTVSTVTVSAFNNVYIMTSDKHMMGTLMVTGGAVSWCSETSSGCSD